MRVKPLLLALALLAGAAAPAAAQDGRRGRPFEPNWMVPTQGRPDDPQRAIRPLREIVDMMRARFGGELIGARLQDGPQPFYEIRWRMPNNDIRDFRVDAGSGQMR